MSIATSIRGSEGDREYAEAVQDALSEKSRLLGRAMSYRDFTLEEVKQRFGLQVKEEREAFASVPSARTSDLLKEMLRCGLEIAVVTSTEKAKSEFIVAPMLLEVRRQLDAGVSLFSGIDFTVAEERGLAGYADFVLARSRRQLTLKAPALVVVEARRNDIKQSLPQCLAEMVGAQLFNRRAGSAPRTIYGSVTSANIWQFMSLTGVDVIIDLTQYYINDVDRIVGILVHMLREEA